MKACVRDRISRSFGYSPVRVRGGGGFRQALRANVMLMVRAQYLSSACDRQ